MEHGALEKFHELYALRGRCHLSVAGC